MNDYEEKQEGRRERYLERAEQAEAEARALNRREHAISDMIPFGQPILVGHHSEGRHRRDVARIQSLATKQCEALDKAEYYRNKAESVGKAGVSSDDPDAIQKLREKVATLERQQALMVAANKCVRKQDRAGLAALGLTESQIEKLFTPDFCGRLGFPGYALTNNSANIRRIKERIEQLEREETREATETEHAGGVRVVQNTEANRIQILFPDKPAEEVRSQLKARGFRWSPREMAWQRHLNNAGVWAADDFMAWYAKQV